MDQKEMYGELTALIRAVAARLDVQVDAVAMALEAGSAQIDFAEDEDGNRAILVTLDQRQAAITPHDLAEAMRAIDDAATARDGRAQSS